MEDTFAQLDQLVSLISSSVETIKQEFRASGQAIPSLNGTKGHPFDTQVTSRPFLDALRTVHGAATQLTTMVAAPQHTVINLSFSHYYSACMNVAYTAKVADHLQAHPEGLHISKLAALTKIDENQLGRILRLLAVKHCFTEVSPDVFANNRLSIHLHSESPVGAFSALLTDENYRAGSMLTDTLLQPDPTFGNGSAFSRALNFNSGGLWEWYQQVDPARGKRFGQAMVGQVVVTKYDSIVTGFPWKSQPKGTTVCDIGGGLGHVCMHLAKSCPQLHVILQDLPGTIEEAKSFWNKEAPDVVKEGRVQLVPMDFLKESPVAGRDYYFMKSVIHDWTDADSKIILRNVRKAMKSSSRLILHEFLIQHVARDDSEAGHFFARAPEPLLANYGDGRVIEYYFDICMMGALNAKERTPEEFIAIGKDSGLELVKVWDCGQMNSIEFKPV